jgi:hypothetical protein
MGFDGGESDINLGDRRNSREIMQKQADGRRQQ